MQFDVFISHSQKDKAVADAVCARLEALNVRCWIAPRDIRAGMDWAESIIGALESCRVMVLIFSSHSNASSQVRREVHQAFERELTVMPFRIEDVKPSKSLEYYMNSVHWLDALTDPMERHIEKLAVQVRAVTEAAVSEPTASPTSPMEQPREPEISRGMQGRPAFFYYRLGITLVLVLAVGLATWTHWTSKNSAKPTAASAAPAPNAAKPDASATSMAGQSPAAADQAEPMQQDDTLAMRQAESDYHEGLHYLFGGPGVNIDDARAGALFRRAADQHFPEAEARMAERFGGGQGVPRDLGTARRYAADALAHGLKNKALAQGGDSAIELAELYSDGIGIPEDHAAAFDLLQRVAGEGNPLAEFALGLYYENGIGTPKDPGKAMELYQKVADQGYPPGYYALGVRYLSGTGVTKDASKAVALFRKAADQGFGPAQYNLARCYYEAAGVPKDFAKATELFQRAADQGIPQAQTALGNCYFLGQGVRKDVSRAVELFKTASNNGDPHAETWLSVCYYEGQGVATDRVKADELLQDAAKKGDVTAIQRIRTLNDQ